MINIKCTGDFNKTEKFLEGMKNLSIRDILNKYGQEGVRILSTNTPKDTGETASSWSYKISTGKRGSSVTWTNNAIVDGVPIVILIQYGHTTKNGGYVSGVDFINPSMKSLFNNMSSAIWKEVQSL